MRAEKAGFVGTKVRVRQEHRILERRGMVGKVVGRYGGEEYVAVDVRFSDGRRRLFWPSDLEKIASPRPSLWPSVLGYTELRLVQKSSEVAPSLEDALLLRA